MKAQFKGIYTFVSAKNVNFANFFFFPILHQVPNAAVISLLCIISLVLPHRVQPQSQIATKRRPQVTPTLPCAVFMMKTSDVTILPSHHFINRAQWNGYNF